MHFDNAVATASRGNHMLIDANLGRPKIKKKKQLGAEYWVTTPQSTVCSRVRLRRRCTSPRWSPERGVKMLVFGLVLLGLKFREPVWSDLVTTRPADLITARPETGPDQLRASSVTHVWNGLFCGRGFGLGWWPREQKQNKNQSKCTLRNETEILRISSRRTSTGKTGMSRVFTSSS